VARKGSGKRLREEIALDVSVKRQEAATLMLAGLQPKEAADRVGVSPATVRRYMKELGYIPANRIHWLPVK
jgi:predicted transcriptional regulator